MAAILIDYENIDYRSMMGLNCLQEDDSLYLYYSKACPTIRADMMAAIYDSGCEFRSFPLKNVGKDALDFYIAAECGTLCERGETNIAVISKDRGFEALRDYLSLKKETQHVQLVLAASIEIAYRYFIGEQYEERKAMIRTNSQKLLIENQQREHDIMLDTQRKICAALRGSDYEDRMEDVLEHLGTCCDGTAKRLYVESLHYFGRQDGLRIYSLLRDVMVA